MTLFIHSIFRWEKVGREERIIMSYETVGAGRERKNLVQKNQPLNKCAPDVGPPRPKGTGAQALPGPSSSL